MTTDPESVSIYDWAVTANLQPEEPSRAHQADGDPHHVPPTTVAAPARLPGES